jgi:hypothetical protein
MIIQFLLIFDIRVQSEVIPCRILVSITAMECLYSQNCRYSLVCAVLPELKCETGPSRSKVRIYFMN